MESGGGGGWQPIALVTMCGIGTVIHTYICAMSSVIGHRSPRMIRCMYVYR